MISELQQRAQTDPKSLSFEEAQTVFGDIVQQIASEQGLDVTAAWIKARALWPTLYSRLCQGKQPVPVDSIASLGNEAQAARFPVPTGSQKAIYLPMFFLPQGLPDDTWAAAWKANAGATPPNPQKIFLGLVTFFALKLGSAAEARRQVLEAYPRLSVAAGEATASMYPSSATSGPLASVPVAKVVKASGSKALANSNSAAGADESERLSMAAAESSADADDVPGHRAAANAHLDALAAAKKVGDSDRAKMHRSMAIFHTMQAAKC